MYSKCIMVSALMTTNIFTLYLQDLNPRMHITACTCIWVLAKLNCKLERSWLWCFNWLKLWLLTLYIWMCIFIPAQKDRLYHYVIAIDVIACKIINEPFFFFLPVHWTELSERTGLQKRTRLPITSKWNGIKWMCFAGDRAQVLISL